MLRGRRKLRIGAAIRPNAGIAAVYRKRLDGLVNEMNASLLYWLSSRWRDNPPPQIATDESWDNKLRRTMRVLARRWQSRFDEVAEEIAKRFAKQVTDHTTARMESILARGEVPTVVFRMSAAVRSVHNAVVAENVGLIKSIAAEHLADVEGIVMRSVATGRDLGTLAKELRTRFDVPRKRAALIARDQTNKATAVITRARQIEAGIAQAIWNHSHAGKVPRPEHVKWDGKPYDVSKGMWSEVDNAWVFPGTPVNCRCFSRPVLPGF